MEERLIMSKCHEYDGPDFIPEPERYTKARDRDIATGAKVNRFEAEKFHKKIKAVERKREKDSFIPEQGGYYKPVMWSAAERQALGRLREEPGGAAHVHNGRGGISLVQHNYRGSFDA